MSKRLFYIIVCLLFSIYFLNGIISIPQLSLTYDEGDNLSYGIRMLKGQPEKNKPFDDASTMPLLVFNGIPRAIEQLKNSSLQKTDDGFSDIMSARYITLLLSSLIGFFILKWTRELYGDKAGLFSLFLFVFCPNINANAVLVTSDALSALFTVSTAYFFWRTSRQPNLRNILFFSFSLGIAQLAKQSLTHLFIVFPTLLILFLLVNRKGLAFTFPRVKKLVVLIVVVLFTINVGFLFHGTGQSLSAYQFRSHTFQGLQQNLSLISRLPLPLPEPYLSGLDLTMNLDEMGTGRIETAGPINILGKSRTKGGFWYYYFVSLFFKTPLSVLLLSVTMFFVFFRKVKMKWYDEMIPVFLILYFLVYFDFFYNSQVGIRHIIMIYPLLYVLLGKTASWIFSKKSIGLLLALYSIFTFYRFLPNIYAYSNEFIWNKEHASRIIGSANIDYGQGYFLLEKFLRKHPFYRFPTETIKSGQYMVSVNYYYDPSVPKPYDWIRKFKPISVAEHCYLLFDITDEDLKKAGF